MPKRDASTAFSDAMRQVQGMFAMNPMMGPQMEQFWKAQDAILEDAEDYAKSWFERRHEATHSALDTVRKINGNGTDPTSAMQAMAEWQRHSMERLTQDMQDWVEMCSRCAGRLASAEMQAAGEGIEEAGSRAKSASKSKNATPV